jgi:hypothetical protein
MVVSDLALQSDGNRNNDYASINGLLINFKAWRVNRAKYLTMHPQNPVMFKIGMSETRLAGASHKVLRKAKRTASLTVGRSFDACF